MSASCMYRRCKLIAEDTSLVNTWKECNALLDRRYNSAEPAETVEPAGRARMQAPDKLETRVYIRIWIISTTSSAATSR